AEIPGDVSPSPDAPAAATTGGAPGRGPLMNSDDSMRTLGEIAAWFRRTEPHSPMAYTLEEAIRRGRLTWPELLAELVADPTARNAILNSLGIRPPPPDTPPA
ncbi:MAG: type VI secretion system protein TssA, partial [Acetobacteraceae bacterium]